MRRRITLSLTGAAVLAASLAAVVAPAAQASPGLIAAMQRDLGLSAGQAQTRLRQELTASRQLPAAQQAAGTAFGGAWFDPARGKLVVGVTDPAVVAPFVGPGRKPFRHRSPPRRWTRRRRPSTPLRKRTEPRPRSAAGTRIPAAAVWSSPSNPVRTVRTSTLSSREPVPQAR